MVIDVGDDPTWTIRPAAMDDADAIGLAHVAAWQAAYRGAMPDAYLDSLRAVDRAEGWRSALGSSDPHRPLLVAVVGTHDVVGFVTFGPDRDGPAPAADDPPGIGELYAVNLTPSSWGLGIGRALVRAATDGLRVLGHVEAVLWVLPTNTRARSLYESEGWRADGGERSFALYGVTVPELRYRRAIAAS